MTARAEETERTGERIVDAMLERFRTMPYANIRLEDVAADADVTIQTVMRRFGNKAGLLVATVQRELGKIVAARAAIAGASPAAIIDALAEHYEIYGALILKMYSEANLAEGLTEIADRGRAYHVAWCRSAFAPDPQVGIADPARRERRMAQIVAVCDARTWYILRVDSGLSAQQTKRAIYEMLAPLIADVG